MFDTIIGNDPIKEELKTSIGLEKVPHSYLFIGIDGIGKKLIAKELAKILLCLGGNKCCGTCKSCIEFDSNNNPDFVFIDAENGSIKIDQIRNMQKRIAEKPIISNKKVYIINNADTMTIEAQNCLLKTLEEPPEYITIILIGANESSFLSTIKSRCTIMHFSKIENEEIKKYLEKCNIQEITQNMIEIADGSIGKAINLKDKSKLYSSIENIINNLNKYDIIDILNEAEVIYKTKEEIFEILEYINILMFKLSKENYKYANCIEIVEETKKRIKANSNYNMCIDYMLFGIWGEVNEKHSWS